VNDQGSTTIKEKNDLQKFVEGFLETNAHEMVTEPNP